MLTVGPDPNWQQDQATRMTNAINLFLNIREKRHAEKEAEIQRHMVTLANEPLLADGDYGTALLKKYPDDPLSSLVMTIRSRNRLNDETEQPLRKYAAALGQESGARDAAQSSVDQMPDTIDAGPIGGYGVPLPPEYSAIPNTVKQSAQAQLNTAPDITYAAWNRLSPEERTAALVGLAKTKMPQVKFPEGFDATHLPPGEQALLATGSTPLSPEMRRAAVQDAGLAAKQGTLDEIAQREETRTKDRLENHENALAVEGQKTKDAIKVIGAREDSRRRLRSEAQADKGTEAGGSPWQKGERKQFQSDLDKGIKDALGGKDSTTPVNVQAGLRNIAMKLVDKGGIKKDASAIQQGLLGNYNSLVSSGMKPYDALKKLEATFGVQ